ncbi:MAG: hypothetical protein QNK92_08700 [Amylibacter sp.]
MGELENFSIVQDVLLPFGAVLFGGLLSLGGTFLALRSSHSLDVERSKAEAKKNDAEDAFRGL